MCRYYRILAILIFVPISVGLIGCSSSTSAPETSGNLAGTVVLYEYTSGNNIAPYFDGASVQLEGTSFVGITDSAGRWSIEDIPAGVYTLDVTKAGYGLLRSFAIPVFGGGTNYVSTLYLPPLPTDSVVIDSAQITELGQTPYIKVAGHSADPITWGVFVDLLPNVNPTDSHLLIPYTTTSGSSTPSCYIRTEDLYRVGAYSGTKIFISACAVGGGPSIYVDPRDGSLRYVSCGPKSNVVQFVVP